MPNMHECDRGQTYHINATVVRAGNLLCWMKRIRTFEIPEIGTVIKVDVDNGVYTMERWVSSMEQVLFQLVTAFGKLVRLAAVCRGGESEPTQIEEIEDTELNGVEEGEYRKSVEEARDEVEGEGELLQPDWRVKAGPDSEREERAGSNTGAIQRLVRPLHDGRERTCRHVIKQKGEDQSRRPTNVMDYCF